MELSEYRGSADSEEELGDPLMVLELKGSTSSAADEHASSGMAGGATRQWNSCLRTHGDKHGEDQGSKHESLDYDQIRNDLDKGYGREQAKQKYYGYSAASVGRWVLTAACGLLIGITAFSMSKAIEAITDWKMEELTRRIKVDLMQRTGDNDRLGLSDGSAAATESIDDAFSFENTRECAQVQQYSDYYDASGAWVQGCGDFTVGREHCHWDSNAENEDGICEQGAVCCVQNAGSPLIFFFMVNTVLAVLACLPVVLFSKEAAGSGIPEVMGYLNGVHIRRLLRLRTLAAKIWGTVMIVSSGAAVGPEGPLVHSGAIIGSGLTRGYKTCGKRRIEQFSIFQLFHNDTDRRDFISMGAAAGFAAAFGAPVGGVLFALEEASSFWNAKLMWRLLLSTSLACFTLSMCRSLDELFARGGSEAEATKEAGSGNYKFEPGMLTLNTKASLTLTHQWELLLCCVLGCLSGVLGAIFNKLVAVRISLLAKPGEPPPNDDKRTTCEACNQMSQRLRQHGLRVIEVVLISLLTSAVMYGLPWVGAYFEFACRPESVATNSSTLSYKYDTYPFYCPLTQSGEKQYNDMATIFLSSRENSILSLVENPHAFSIYSLVTIAVSFFMLMVISFGVAVPAGIFMPTIVVGCTFGALFGRCAKYISCLVAFDVCIANRPFEPSDHGHGGMRIDDPEYAQYLTNTISHAGPYALLGAVGLLGGIQRSSVSLVVIIVEGTGKIDYLLPIIFTTVCAKWVGDHLNDGIYHTAMHIKKIPFLENEPTRALKHKSARDIMCRDPICVKTEMKVRDVRQLLQTPGQRCNGFPVVKEVVVGHHAVQVYQGIILLQNLGVLLKRQRFYRRNEQEGRLERVKSGHIPGAGEVRTEIVDRTRTLDSSDQCATTGGTAMEMTLLPSPATRVTVSEMDHAKHRSNHDGLIDEALANLEPAQEDLYLNIAEAMNRAPYHVLADTCASKVHRLFRTMGLRHLVVTSELNEVEGIITRADLIRHSHTSAI